MARNGNGSENLPGDLPKTVLKDSVTKDDVAKYAGNGIVNFLLPAFGGAYYLNGLPPELPNVNTLTPYSKARDVILVMTPRVEGFWANAIHIAMSKIISRGIQFEAPVSRRVDVMNELFRVCDGRRGFATFLERHLYDYLNTSNGAWVEIERVSRNPGAKIISFHHLDSLRVWRTGDPDTPAVYWDLRGNYHELKWWECFNVTDMESSRAGYWYGGECAAERAYMDIRAVFGMTKYFDEKITGSGYQKITLIPGITIEQIENAKTVGEQNQLAKGIIYYQGTLMIPYYGDANSFKDKIEIQLKGLPDDWKRQEELDIRLLNYANTLGIAPFELDPRLTARGSLGVGQQSAIIDENEKGRGLGSWEKKFLGHVNNLITPDATVALLVTIDLREEKQKADIELARAQTRAAMRGVGQVPGEITPQQSLYMAVEDDDAPRAFLDMTTPVDETLTTEQKPESESEQAAQSNAEAQQTATESAPESSTPVVKEIGFYRSMNLSKPGFVSMQVKEKRNPARELVKQEMENARKLVRRIKQKPVEKESQQPMTLNVQVPAPKVDVVVNVPKQDPPQVTVNNQIPKQDTPVVNVNVPEQKEIKPPQVTVNIPKQDVPQVTVNVPKQDAPKVEVKNDVKVPDVKVNVENKILPQAKQKRTLKVTRDKQTGQIAQVEEE